ncbi:MAG: disulfide bond formation protein B [Alphaproteobacteria bacterium]|nr:disulfide bond formation protein B [Alphaproteobacteria bacterium]
MSTVRASAVIVTAGSILILAGAFAFQYIGDLAPCVLCIYQRYPYGVAIVLGVLAIVLWRTRAARWLLALAGVALIIDAGIAGFHVGVEQQWWAGTAECGGNLGGGLSLEQLKSQILAAPVVRCDEVAWSLFGISMAGYNMLLALALAATALRSAFGKSRSFV